MSIITNVCMLLNYYVINLWDIIILFIVLIIILNYIQINLLESIEFFYISVEIVQKESTTELVNNMLMFFAKIYYQIRFINKK